MQTLLSRILLLALKVLQASCIFGTGLCLFLEILYPLDDLLAYIHPSVNR